jgi:arylsulfatase
MMSGLDWFPTFAAAAGNPDIVEELKKGKQLGERSYKVHLDGYNQLDFLAGKEPSKRHEIIYFAEGTLGAVRVNDFKYRFIDQPQGWLGGTVKPVFPILVNLRLDPLERTGLSGSLQYLNWYEYEFWRYVFVQQVVAKMGESFVEFPPMQKPASFNLEAVKEQIVSAIKSKHGE